MIKQSCHNVSKIQLTDIDSKDFLKIYVNLKKIHHVDFVINVVKSKYGKKIVKVVNE
jgi:hypothetical protein